MRVDADNGRVSVNCYRDEIATPHDAGEQVARILNAYPNQVTQGFAEELIRQFMALKFTKQQCKDSVDRAIRNNEWANISTIVGNRRELQLYTGKEFVAMQDGGKHKPDEFYKLNVKGTFYVVFKKWADLWGVDVERLEKYLNAN